MKDEENSSATKFEFFDEDGLPLQLLNVVIRPQGGLRIFLKYPKPVVEVPKSGLVGVDGVPYESSN